MCKSLSMSLRTKHVEDTYLTCLIVRKKIFAKSHSDTVDINLIQCFDYNFQSVLLDIIEQIFFAFYRI